MSKRPVKEPSKKCFNCGLRNFAVTARCARCGYDVWVPLPGSDDKKPLPDNSRKLGRIKVSVLICAAVLLLGLAVLNIRQDSKGKPEAVAELAIQQPATQPTEQPEKVIAQEALKSQEAGKQVIARLERFHREIESSVSYEKYDELLTQLRADLNSTLPSFVEHKPGDEFFRREVDAAVRDYSAAGSWWKTADQNSAVLTDADRAERLTANWTSAKTHLDNAEQMLGR